MQVNGTGRILLEYGAGYVSDHGDFSLQERALAIHGQEFETVAAFGDEVELAIGIFLDDGNDFGGATDFGQILLHGADYAEDTILRQAFADHFFIARFEDVQRQGSAGEQYDIEREQGDENGQGVSGRAKRREMSDWFRL